MDEFAGVKLLCVHTHGPGLFHTKDPVTKLEDLKGMKIRGGSRIINDMLARLGAEPVGMPVPQVPEALSTGVISGTTIPWEVTPSLKVAELVQEPHRLLGHARALHADLRVHHEPRPATTACPTTSRR